MQIKTKQQQQQQCAKLGKLSAVINRFGETCFESLRLKGHWEGLWPEAEEQILSKLKLYFNSIYVVCFISIINIGIVLFFNLPF